MHGRFTTYRSLRSDVEATAAHTAHSFPRHTHEHFGIGVMEHGAQRSWSGRGWVEAGPGQAITVNPGEVHDGRPIGDAPRAWSMLYFVPRLAHTLADEISEGRAVECEFTDPVIGEGEVAARFRTLFAVVTGPEDSLSRMLVEQMLLGLFGRLATRFRPAPKTLVPDAVRLARELIDDDPATPITLDHLAAATGLSRFQLIRGFTRSTGLTPHAYIVQRRLQLVRRLIAGGRPLADSALACGFSDQSHMTRLFRRTYGISPRSYAEATA